jgi:hypothetical protein
VIGFLEGVQPGPCAELSTVLVRVFGAIVILIERRRAGLIIVGSTRGRRMQLPQTRLDSDRLPARGRRKGDHTRRIWIVDDETTVHLRGRRADSIGVNGEVDGTGITSDGPGGRRWVRGRHGL